LRTIIAFDDHDIGDRVRLPHLDVLLILGRPITGERTRIVGKLDNHMARSAFPFYALELPRAHDEAPTVFAEDRRIGGRLRLVSLLVMHVDASDPISLGHIVTFRRLLLG
jgi:hypothetical protein